MKYLCTTAKAPKHFLGLHLLRNPSPFGQDQVYVFDLLVDQLLPHLLLQAGQLCLKMNLLFEDTGFLAICLVFDTVV